MICRKCRCEAPDAPFCCLCGAKQEVGDRKPKRRGNGTGTAYKRGKTWTAQRTLYTTIDAAGTKHRKYQTKGGFATKKEALQYLEHLTGAEERTPPKLITLWENYEKSQLPKLSKDKQIAYKKARQRLDPLMGRRIDTLTTADLQSTVSSSCSTYYTARDCKTVLSKLYQAACSDRFVPSNLAQFIALPDLKEKEAEPFTAEEVEKIWAAYSDGDIFAGYMLVMIYSGMMPGELLALRKDMIDLDKCEIYGAGKKTETRKRSALVFAECVRPVLAELMENAVKDKLICRQKDSWYKDYHEATQRIGIRDLTPYACRHTTGTEAAKLGLNASTIQQIMRHAKITTSQRYIHLGSSEAHTALNQFAQTVSVSQNQDSSDSPEVQKEANKTNKNRNSYRNPMTNV